MLSIIQLLFSSVGGFLGLNKYLIISVILAASGLLTYHFITVANLQNKIAGVTDANNKLATDNAVKTDKIAQLDNRLNYLENQQKLIIAEQANRQQNDLRSTQKIYFGLNKITKDQAKIINLRNNPKTRTKLLDLINRDSVCNWKNFAGDLCVSGQLPKH